MKRRRGHHGFAAPAAASTRRFQTVTAAEIERQQAEHERALKGTEDMRRALSRPGSLFRLRRDVAPSGPLTGLQVLVEAPSALRTTAPGFKAGAVLLFLGRTRAQDLSGIDRPTHVFFAMGMAARFVVRDFDLIEPC